MKFRHALKIVSILMILAAFVRFVFGITMFHFFSVSAIVSSLPAESLRYAVTSIILILVFGGAMIACGFYGAICWDDPAVAMKCFFFGLGTLILGLLGNLFQWLGGYSISMPVWVCSVGVPILFILVSLILSILYRRQKRGEKKS